MTDSETTAEPRDLTSCTKCHQLLKSPRTLPCLHSYCATCLEELAAGSSAVRCAECGEDFDIPPGGIKEWQPLAIVQRLVEQKRIHVEVSSGDNIHCTSCVDDASGDDGHDNKTKAVPSIAVARCTECNDYLCEQCVTAHKTQRVLKTHRVATFDELREGHFSDVDVTGEKVCAKHEGEALLFYCETCDVPICLQCVVNTHFSPEHKYVELEPVAKEKKEQLYELQGRGKDNEEDVTAALQDIRQTKDEYVLAVVDVRLQIEDAVRKLKSSFLKRLDEAQKAAEDELKKIAKESMETIKNADDQLTSISSRMATAKDIATVLQESGSDFEVASDYGNLKNALQGVTATDPYSIIHPTQYVTDVYFEENAAEDSEAVVIGWGMSRGARRKRELENDPSALRMDFGDGGVAGKESLGRAIDIAVTPTGDVAVTDHNHHQIKIFDECGKFKSAFNINVEVDAGETGHPWCIQVGPNDLFYITDYLSPFVKVFDSEGKYKRHFYTTSPDDVPYKMRGTSTVCGMAINHNAQVLVGNITHNFISYHSLHGKHLRSMNVMVPPWFLAVTSEGNILCTSYRNSSEVQIIHEDGDVLTKLEMPSGVSSWIPTGLAVSKCYSVVCGDDEVFVADRGNGHAIYRYSSSGKFINCVTKEVSNVYNMALSANEKLLFVADCKSVKCFEI